MCDGAPTSHWFPISIWERLDQIAILIGSSLTQRTTELVAPSIDKITMMMCIDAHRFGYSTDLVRCGIDTTILATMCYLSCSLFLLGSTPSETNDNVCDSMYTFLLQKIDKLTRPAVICQDTRSCVRLHRTERFVKPTKHTW